MPRQLLVFEEVIAILGVVKTPQKFIDAFRKQAEFVIEKKDRKDFDNVAVASGFGQKSQQGFVELSIDETLTQMDAKKAQAVGLMLLQAAEAAQSDEIFLKFLEKIGIEDPEKRGHMLLDLREIRQGSKSIVILN